MKRSIKGLLGSVLMMAGSSVFGAPPTSVMIHSFASMLKSAIGQHATKQQKYNAYYAMGNAFYQLSVQKAYPVGLKMALARPAAKAFNNAFKHSNSPAQKINARYMTAMAYFQLGKLAVEGQQSNLAESNHYLGLAADHFKSSAGMEGITEIQKFNALYMEAKAHYSLGNNVWLDSGKTPKQKAHGSNDFYTKAVANLKNAQSFTGATKQQRYKATYLLGSVYAGQVENYGQRQRSLSHSAEALINAVGLATTPSQKYNAYMRLATVYSGIAKRLRLARTAFTNAAKVVGITEADRTLALKLAAGQVQTCTNCSIGQGQITECKKSTGSKVKCTTRPGTAVECSHGQCTAFKDGTAICNKPGTRCLSRGGTVKCSNGAHCMKFNS